MPATQAYRATLPIPLPTNWLRMPRGQLDTLVVVFRRREDSVTVVSEATGCSATYWCAIGEACLTSDDERSGPDEVPLVPGEVRALEDLDALANEWDAAVKNGSEKAIRTLAQGIEAMDRKPGRFRFRVEV